MPTSSIKPGDIIRVNLKGRVFYALVEVKEGRDITFAPIADRGITFRTCKSNQVEAAWRKLGGSRS